MQRLLYNISELKKVFKEWLFFLKKKHTSSRIENVSIFIWQVEKNTLFIAIKNIYDNGYNYIERIEQAIKNGSNCIICEQIDEKFINSYSNVCFVIVQDSLKALQDLARYQRSKLKKTKIIGITGSLGKTTTRELVKLAVCAEYKKTSVAILNYNNEIGCPLTIVNTPIDTECLILELGMRKFGDIDFLSRIAKPNIAIITKISASHIGNFNNISEIVKAKAEIFNHLDGDKIVILNKSDVFFKKMLFLAQKKGITNIVTVGKNSNAGIFLRRCKLCDNLNIKYTVSVDGKEFICRLNSIKKHDADNSLFAFAIAKIFNIDFEKVSNNLLKFSPIEGHGNVWQKKVNGKIIHVLDDCYNSSPDALKDSIIALSNAKKMFPNSRAVAVIGDMLDLGKESEKYHLEIANILAKYKNIDFVVCIGKDSKIIFDNLPSIFEKRYFEKTDDFAKEISDFIKNDDLLLFKASHGLHFCNLIKILKDDNCNCNDGIK